MEVQSADIAKRLEELNKWQEEQKKLLNERQNMQRKMLGLEQRSMYKMLGLMHSKHDEDNGGGGDNLERKTEICEKWTAHNAAINHSTEVGQTNFDLIEKESEELEGGEEYREEEEERTEATATQRTSGYYTDDVLELRDMPKRTFLKRGEGLKQRFKIDPDSLRINNLPPYKFASSHPSLTSLHSKRSTQSIRLAKFKDAEAAEQPQKSTVPFDAQEKRFQQLLISSNSACSSTPEIKSSSYSSIVSATNVLQHVKATCYVECNQDQAPTRAKTPTTHNSTLETESISPLPPMTWSEVLDSQQIRPIPVQHMRSRSLGEGIDDTAEQHQLNIFELLEQRAHEGSIDMNSSYIKHFMERKLRDRIIDKDEIPVHSSLKEVGLQPEVKTAIETITSSEDEYSSEVTGAENKTATATSPMSRKSSKSQLKVRFTVEDNNNQSAYETTSDTSTLVGEDSTLNSVDMFQQFKDALYSALQSRAEKVKNELLEHNPNAQANNTQSIADPTTQAPSASSVGELQEKTDVIKLRLEELEKEIATFKENNMKLMRAKQEHELEKAQFTQERLEVMDRLNDEKIQLEIYLHDERMKIEEEKQKFQQKMRSIKSTLSNSERKELAQLKVAESELHMQLKEREQVHVASQARLRAKIRNLEKDQKQLLDEVEALKKENIRLQNDIARVSRENNNKMLHEINRNIAKLAPKLASSKPASPEENVTAFSKNRTAASKPPSSKALAKGNEKCKRERSNSQARTSKSENKANPVIAHYYSSSDSEEMSARSRECPGRNKEENCDKDVCAYTNSQSTATETENRNTTRSPTPLPSEFKREIINSDGSKDIWYPNGNLKKISADGMNIRMLYFNKDIKETNINEGTVKYYYAATNTWHTTYLDGLEILEFPNGQTEHRHKNGIVEVHFPNNSVKVTNPTDEHKLEEWRFADGTNLVQMRNGDRVLIFSNGQKEIHTKMSKRREYPDGTIKLVYPDGSQETRYSNGRVRLKDKDGTLIMDTERAMK